MGQGYLNDASSSLKVGSGLMRRDSSPLERTMPNPVDAKKKKIQPEDEHLTRGRAERRL